MRKLFILIGACVLLSGCGNDKDTTTTQAKNLFSSWAEDGSSFVLDMTAAGFGTSTITFLVTGNALCDCTLLIGGTQSSGNAVISGCTYRNGTGGGVDPGCASLDASYTYTKTATVLTICNGGTCGTYR